MLVRIPEKFRQEGLLQYAERLSRIYAKASHVRTRKLRGQFFTPGQVSKFMANLLDINHNTIRLLDPGAGTGILSAAFCEQILNNDRTVNLNIDAYENDPDLLPLLGTVLDSCKTELEKKGHNSEYKICEQDFILHNERCFRSLDLFWASEECLLYDLVICNPPYYKLNKNSPQSTAMMELVSGQPNIYPLFMALSASMVKSGGQMVFITPRSFCSGLYYRKFREWFLNNVQIVNVHIFESRNEVFGRDGVLQENIIIKAEKREKANRYGKLNISTSVGKDFARSREIEIEAADLICHSHGQTFIRIPTSSLDIDVLNIVDTWPGTLTDLGFRISTGPVVPFRAEEYLLHDTRETPESAPLLWMHNMQGMRVVWPLKKNRKASAIRICNRTTPLLLPVKNYVLVKRFTSKEQRRRLYASVILESEFSCKVLGIENHVNYIHRPNGNLSVYEAFGIAAMLNTTIVDSFFRSMNGNTQVNATDIRSLPFPSVEHIKEIGKLVRESQYYLNGSDLDNIVTEVLGIDAEIVESLKKGD
jgi:adenine-specific DNA-methyltransferase